MTINNKYELILPVVSVLLLMACNSDDRLGEDAPSPSTAKGKTVFVLFDISESTKAEETRRKYLESFNKIVTTIGEGDVLTADFISDDPLGQSTFAINREFPVFQPDTDNPLLIRKQKGEFDKQIEDLRKQERDKAAQMLGSVDRKVRWTRILDANLLAEKVFKKFDRPKKVLVLFSDMIESTEKLEFHKFGLSDKATKKIIEDEKSAGRLPDLSSVRVYVVGATGARSADSFNQIQNFWLVYFKAAGADLSKENYGAALLKFDE